MVPVAQAPPAPTNQQSVTYRTTPATTTTTTHTTHSTHSTENVDIDVNMNVGGIGMNVAIDERHHHPEGHVHTTTTTTRITEEVVETSDECHTAMAYSDFESAKKTIEAKSFDDSQLTIAKQIANSNCLSSQQVAEVMRIFSFEDSRLEFAKHAYDSTVDKGNYFKVNDAFKFESSIDELNEFLGQ